MTTKLEKVQAPAQLYTNAGEALALAQMIADPKRLQLFLAFLRERHAREKAPSIPVPNPTEIP